MLRAPCQKVLCLLPTKQTFIDPLNQVNRSSLFSMKGLFQVMWRLSCSATLPPPLSSHHVISAIIHLRANRVEIPVVVGNYRIAMLWIVHDFTLVLYFTVFFKVVYWELSHIHTFCVWSQQINISLKLSSFFHLPLPVLPHYPSQLVCRCCCSRASLWPWSWPAGSVPKGRAVWHYHPSSRSGLLVPQVDLFMATFSAICIQTLGIKKKVFL